jgi:hypothetical protein
MIPEHLPANAIASASPPCKMKSRKRGAHFSDFGDGINDRHPSFSAIPRGGGEFARAGSPTPAIPSRVDARHVVAWPYERAASRLTASRGRSMK